MRAVGEGRLANTSTSFERHIDRCLGCRACEQVCPAGVEYGQLLEAARGELFTAGPSRGFSYGLVRLLLKHVWPHPARLKLLFRTTRAFRDSGLAGALRKSGLARVVSKRFNFALALIESSSPRLPGSTAKVIKHPQASSADNSTMLFTGCVGAGLFSRVKRSPLASSL